MRADFEPWSGWVRRICIDGVEVVRAIYAAVRDENWATRTPKVLPAPTRSGPEGFSVAWRTGYEKIGFAFESSVSWDGKVLVYEAKGIAKEDFSTQRTGVCVLHPHEQAGLPLAVRQSDGKSVESLLPVLISPHQPAFGIAGLRIGGALSFEFEGEVFEMEDQRNWSDASFKTYCRPLDLPRPYVVQAGGQLRHVVRISLDGSPPTPKSRPPLKGTLAPPVELEGWTAANQARQFFGGFVELNRAAPFEAPQPAAFSLTPQVHAFDDRSIMENVLPLPDIAATAREICRAAVLCGPASLGGRGMDPRAGGPLGSAWEAAMCLMAGACSLPLSFGDKRPLPVDLAPFEGEDIVWDQYGESVDVLVFAIGADHAALVNMNGFPAAWKGVELAPHEVKVVPKQ